MHPDSKLANHGKTGNSSAQPQPPHHVSQGPPCSLGAKGVGAGSHGGKVGQPPPGNPGLTPAPAPAPPVFAALKGKVKRERSVSVDSGERQEGRAASLGKEPKGEVAPRSKRRCVLERKQPYSGDEWCSGPDSEDDEKALSSSHGCNVAEPAMTAASQLGAGSNPLPALSESNASGTPHTAVPGLRPEARSGGVKQPLQFVYVFTTHLANTAAEAVLQGRADSILGFHQQHVPRTKLDQVPPCKAAAVPEPLPTSPSPASTPQAQAAVPPSSQAQGGQPPAHAQPPPQASASAPLGLSQGALPSASAIPPEAPSEDARRDLTPNSVGNSGGSSTAPSSTHPSTPTAPGSLPGTAPDGLQMGEGAPPGGPSAGNGPRHALSTEGLSKEQLEHRERSLQTLRDIERLLLRSTEAEPFLKGGGGPSEGGLLPPQQPAPPPGSVVMKKYEEPLQSMISQTQSLGGPSLEPEGPAPPGGADMGQQMNMMMQRLGQDSLTPEQVAWRKLQEEYYEEKRRKEEQVGMHGGRPLPEMLLPPPPPQPMSGMMLRGPPPPYHSKPGEQWLLRGVPVEPMPDPMQMRPPFAAGPRFPGSQVQRGFGGMQNMPPLESLGPLSNMQRPVRPGMAWNEEMAMGGSGNFAPGSLAYPPGQAEAERFLTPRAREEMLRQQLLEKRQAGMQRPLGVEMERMMQAHRQVETTLFAGEALGLEFGGARAVLSPPLREMEPPLGPGNLNMNMNVNMNMNLNVQMAPQQQQQQVLLSQKLRGPELVTSEDVARARAPSGNGAMMGGPHKMLMGCPFPGQGQQQQQQGGGFSAGGQGPYPAVTQEMGSAAELFGTLGSTTRLSHIPLAPTTHAPPTNMPQAPPRGLGRRPSDLALNMGQMNSPGVSRLKSPTLSQVHSPLGTSPSASLKSPQTPSAMVGLPAASAPSGPLKSPQVLSSVLNVRSPTSSPGHLKSPSMAASSPGWAPSPKNSLSSPGISQSKPAIGMSNIEQDPPPSQNPLSLMMSQMSKYALPSSTPLYHNAIKTIATSEDELLPDRPMLPGAMAGMASVQPSQLHMNSVGGAPLAQSPMAISLPGQQPLSHEPPPPSLSSPSPLGSSMPMHGSAPPQAPLMLPPGAQDSGLGQPCAPPGQLVFPARLPQPPTNGGGTPLPPQQQQHYAPGMGLPPEELPPPQPGPMVPPQQQQRLGGRLPDPFPPGLPSVASVLSDPDLSDVIRPTPTGIPEFDLSRIIPSEKPSSTLQYFPKGEGQPPKAQPPSNLHLMNLQNMMVEQAPGRPGPQGIMPRSMAMCHPGQVPVLGRTGMAPQQAMMGNSMHQGMMLPQQNLMAQQNFLLMQAKQRSMSVSGEMYAPPGHLLSPPQGALMGPPPQQNLMVTHPMRQRSISLDGQVSYGGPGGGSMANLPF